MRSTLPVAKSQPRVFELGKLFVGGILPGVSEDDLRSHFSWYGEVDFVYVPRDIVTGRARGFAFVQFVRHDHAERALTYRHVLNGRMVDVKRAEPKGAEDRSSTNQMYQNQRPSYRPSQFGERKKVFVGGLPPDFEEDKLRDYFKNFGYITDATVITDASSRRSRGFGFVAFNSEDCVNQVVQKKYHNLFGALVEVKRAKPRDSRLDQCRSASSSLSVDAMPACSRLSVDAAPFYPREYVPCNDPSIGYGLLTPAYCGYASQFGNFPSLHQGMYGRQPFLYPAVTAYFGYPIGGFIGNMTGSGVAYQQSAVVSNGEVQAQVTMKPEVKSELKSEVQTTGTIQSLLQSVNFSA